MGSRRDGAWQWKRACLARNCRRARRVGKARTGPDYSHRQKNASAGSHGRFEEARRLYEPGARPEIRKDPAGLALTGAALSGNGAPNVAGHRTHDILTLKKCEISP